MFQVERSHKRRRRNEIPSTAHTTPTSRDADTVATAGSRMISLNTTTSDNTNRASRDSGVLGVTILQGVNACLSGFATEDKDRYHKLVVELGGTYTRHLQLDKNTHLIARQAKGEKYEAAVRSSASSLLGTNNSHQSGTSARICIVRPSWLEECLRTGRRVDEREHHLSLSDRDKKEEEEAVLLPADKTEHASTRTTQQSSDLQQKSVSLRSCLKDLLLHDNNDDHDVSMLFSACHFYLAGFESQENGNSSKSNNKNNNNNNNETTDDTLPLLLLRDLGKLIRRGLGTIYWDFQEGLITHVIVLDGADKSIRDAARAISSQRPFDAPEFVSPWWVMRSWSARKLLNPSEFAPIYQSLPSHNNNSGVDQHNKTNTTATTTTSSSQRNLSKALWKDCLFAVLRIAPPCWAVDFSTKDMEKTIRTNGGKMLSLKIVEALKIDQAGQNTNNNNNTKKDKPVANMRTCYVVGWGGAITPQNLEIHPLLSQVKRHALCHLVQVTPIWLMTCLTEQCVLKPTSISTLFVPSKRPMHLLKQQQQDPKPSFAPPSVNHQTPVKNRNKKAKVDDNAALLSSSLSSASSSPPSLPLLRISITGFQSYQRSALIRTIQAMGAIYDDSMSMDTTHLICRSKSGPKYETALNKWTNIKIVSIEWLYHVMQYGFHGKEAKIKQRKTDRQEGSSYFSGGCEALFPIK